MQQHKVKKTDPGKKYRRVLAASTLEGDKVRNSAGEDLGKVDEIMIDIPSGRVAYAVLSFGGVLGMGNKLFAVPWNALVVDEDERCFTLDVDKQALEAAPGFDKDNWPDMADATSAAQIYRYYGASLDADEEGRSTEAVDYRYAFEEDRIASTKGEIALHRSRRVRARRDQARAGGQAWRAIGQAGYRDRTVESQKGRGEIATPAGREGAQSDWSQAESEAIACHPSRS